MDCIFQEQNGQFVCEVCGFTTPIPNLHINCSGKPQDKKEPPVPPSLVQRSKNLAKAIGRHLHSGRKHCTEEQKAARFKQCSSNECGLFLAKGKGGICAHEDCGCYIRSNGKFLDKLSWADSKCPEGYWGPENDEETPENGV